MFQVVYAGGKRPRTDVGWSQEAALDIEWSHAMAPNAKIVLVEAASSSFNDMFAAVRVASTLPGVKEVSMSWGGSEFSSERMFDTYFTAPGVVYFAASGDIGGATIYPGVSPNVVSAGGTRINRDKNGKFISETGWSGSGGGPSKYEPVPGYQLVITSVAGLVKTQRGTPDLSFNADPASGVAVYDSTPYGGRSGWMVFGGTSAAAPALAGILNLAASSPGGRFATSTNQELTKIYSNLGTSSFRDILTGTAGKNRAASGWDFVTGVGSCLGLSGK